MKSWNLCIFIIFNMSSFLNSSNATDVEKTISPPTTREPATTDVRKKITILETAHERCNVFNCPRKRGVCTRDTSCKCNEGFISVNDDEFPFYCNYEQKRQLNAFLLEFFIGFGIGHLYNGNIQIAMIKLILYFVAYFILCFIPYFTAQTKSNFLNRVFPCFQTMAILTIVIWQIVDSVLLGINWFPDGNGIPLMTWDGLTLEGLGRRFLR